jgi:hypothetical protein
MPRKELHILTCPAYYDVWNASVSVCLIIHLSTCLSVFLSVYSYVGHSALSEVHLKYAAFGIWICFCHQLCVGGGSTSQCR